MHSTTMTPALSTTSTLPRHSADILPLIYAGTAAVTGDEFFRELVKATASALNVHSCFVAEFADSRDRVRTLAYWAGGRFVPDVEFDLRGTPCEAVLRGEVCYYPSNVQKLFPRDGALAEKNIHGYLATPMLDAAGKVLGHLAVLHDRPMETSDLDLAAFKIFGARAAAEVDRKRAQEAVTRSEQRLASILDTAMDVIIAVDADLRITLFNHAAENVFRCSSSWARGQPLDRFLSRPFRKILHPGSGEFGPPVKPIWAPEGLSAIRADGEEFPVEVTVSPLMLDGDAHFTVILRDRTDREAAAAAIRRLELERVHLREEMRRRQGFAEIVGDSPPMQALFEDLAVVAETDATVLLTGETGTGKELIAREVHMASPRKDRLLVIVNCAALPTELIESELFGHEKGAFTGATAQRKGRFELADHGTIFLDEVGELTPQAQVKLLRALQEHSFERVGGTQTMHVDVRVIAATNRDLASMVVDGSFREDLFYRLDVFPIRVPPLRERTGDISRLANYFLAQAGRKLGKTFKGMTTESVAQLTHYAWPGNVRELQNVIMRAAILERGEVLNIDERALPKTTDVPTTTPNAQTLEAIERDHIRRILEDHGWQIEGRNGAATALGLKPSTLRFRMRKLGIERGQVIGESR